LPPRILPPKAAGKASPTGARSDLISYLQFVFGEDLPPITDARAALRLQPTPPDAVNAKPRSPNACLLARTAARMYGSRGVAFFKGLAYVDLVDEYGYRRLERFLAGKATMAVIRDFDAGTPIGFGFAVILYPPSKPHTLPHKRRAARKHHRTPAGRATAELSNANQAVRNATDHAERIAEALRQAKAAGDTKQAAKWTKRAKAAVARLVVVRDRLTTAQRQADQARQVRQGRTVKPRRLDLTSRNGCLGRYCFADLRSGVPIDQANPIDHARATNTSPATPVRRPRNARRARRAPDDRCGADRLGMC
jgi:hypothetical protein